jgi:hypothetical protein
MLKYVEKRASYTRSKLIHNNHPLQLSTATDDEKIHK